MNSRGRRRKRRAKALAQQNGGLHRDVSVAYCDMTGIPIPYRVHRKSGKERRGFLVRDRAHQSMMLTIKLLWEDIDTPISLGLYLRMKYGCWQDIAEKRVHPKEYASAERFRKDYMAVSLLRKYPGLPIEVDRKAASLGKFVECEDYCRETNNILRAHRRGLLRTRNVQVEGVLQRAKSKIAYVLGALNLNEIFEGCRWGPGMTSANNADAVSAYNKFDTAPETTAGCLRYAQCAINSVPTWAQAVLGSDYPCSVLPSLFSLCHGNRVTTVPKDALIDRVIAIEPHMNVFMQLGVGGVIRKRLLRVGVDLDKGQPINGQMARLGARDGTHATIDLSSASDTVSYELVKTLLPEEWFDLLNALRSHRYRLSKKKEEPVTTYEKFSSMGNGFTFELETLIFWALSYSCLSELNVADQGLCVYGDDIIVPVISFPLVCETLLFVGFRLNEKKTFATTPFRESCGEHYFGNLDVKPVYLDSVPETSLEVIAFANQMVLAAVRWGEYGALDGSFKRAREALICALPECDRLFGPLHSGDNFLVGNFQEASPNMKRLPFGWEGYSFLSLQPVPRKREMWSRATLPTALYLIRKEKGPSWCSNRPITWLARKSVPRKREVWEQWLGTVITESPSQGTYAMRGTPRCFETKRIEVLRPQYVGVWSY